MDGAEENRPGPVCGSLQAGGGRIYNTEVGKGKCPKGRHNLPPPSKRISGGRGAFPIKLLEGPLCRDDM